MSGAPRPEEGSPGGVSAPSPEPQEWIEVVGEGPLVAVAVHAGGAVRTSLRERFALDEPGRFREEDPFTDRWASLAPTHLIGTRSRFEVDLNRPPEKAVYRIPEDAWGLRVWEGDLPEAEFRRSLGLHECFYQRLGEVLDEKVDRHGGFVLLDFHSYNHRRVAPDGPPADPHENPEVNIGTGTLDRTRWGALIDRFIADLRDGDEIIDRDVRENEKFRGGYVPLWTHTRYPTEGVALAVEFKKTFMDEWTGVPDDSRIDALARAVERTFPGLLEGLEAVLASDGEDA